MKAAEKTRLPGPRGLAREGGLTLIEVLVAMFILSIGVIGVLAALPVGIDTAQEIIIQDNSLAISQSKWGEFRRDRINPGELGLASYHAACAAAYNARHGGGAYGSNVCRSGCGGSFYSWHSFESDTGDAFENFADIVEYEWRLRADKHQAVENFQVVGPAGGTDVYYVPTLGARVDAGGVSSIGLYRMVLDIRKKQTQKRFTYETFMTSYD